MASRLARPALLAWILLQAGSRGDWQPVDEYPSELTCMRVRAIRVADETRAAIGSALADQPFDNPVRQQAFDRAEKRVGARYRCLWQSG